MNVRILRPKSEYYRGPVVQGDDNYVLHVECDGQDVYVGFDKEADLPGALVKAGVHIEQARAADDEETVH